MANLDLLEDLFIPVAPLAKASPLCRAANGKKSMRMVRFRKSSPSAAASSFSDIPRILS